MTDKSDDAGYVNVKLTAALRARVERDADLHHRSMAGELCVLVEEALLARKLLRNRTGEQAQAAGS